MLISWISFLLFFIKLFMCFCPVESVYNWDNPRKKRMEKHSDFVSIILSFSEILITAMWGFDMKMAQY